MSEKNRFNDFEIDQTLLTPLTFEEPELHSFSAADVFEAVESKPVKKRFGKRSERRAEVKIKVYDAFDDPKPVKKEEEPVAVVEEEPVVEEVIVETKPAFEDVEIEAEFVEEEPAVEENVEHTLEMKPVEQPIEKVEEEAAEEDIDVPMEEEVDIDAVVFPVGKDAKQEEDEEENDEEDDDDEDEEEDDDLSSQYDEDDLLYEKKSFLISEYDKKEKYLAEQSKDVYHLVKIDGKTFYFVEGEKKDYYYTYVYLRKEPSDEQKHKWELDGWKYICRQRGKKKRHAGWFVFRNEDVPGDYRKYIENDLEKYNFFKKEVKSYGSTQMIFFLCIIVCAVCAYIQYRYNGYLIGIAACGVIGFIAFIYWIRFALLKRQSKKKVKQLKSRLRVKQREMDIIESEKGDDEDWDTLEDVLRDQRKKKRKK